MEKGSGLEHCQTMGEGMEWGAASLRRVYARREVRTPSGTAPGAGMVAARDTLACQNVAGADEGGVVTGRDHICVHGTPPVVVGEVPPDESPGDESIVRVEKWWAQGGVGAGGILKRWGRGANGYSG